MMADSPPDDSVTVRYVDFDASRIKHLEMIQAVISRLAGNGFLMKGWAVAVAGVFFGFAVNKDSWQLSLVAMLPTSVFWGLDAYLLRAERMFRELYRQVAFEHGSVRPFDMAATTKDFIKSAPTKTSGYWRTLFGRPILTVFYGGLLVAALLVLLIVASTDPAVPHP